MLIKQDLSFYFSNKCVLIEKSVDIWLGKQDKHTDEVHNFSAVWSEGTVKWISIF